MAYPTDTGQSYTTINGTDNTGATLGDGLTHSGRHNAVEDEVTALKEKVGIDGDSDNSTLDFKTSEITGGDTAVGKSATQTLTNKTLTSPTINTPTISLWDGWDERTVGDYSYASTTTINTSSDKTGEIQAGDKIKIVTAGGTFYFFVTAITSSAITVYGGTDYTVPNATFTQFAISRVKAPFGFPLSEDKWTITTSTLSLITISSPSGTGEVSSNLRITLPTGRWRLRGKLDAQIENTAKDFTSVVVYASSDTGSTAMTEQLTGRIGNRLEYTSGNSVLTVNNIVFEDEVGVSSPTGVRVYYTVESGTPTYFRVRASTLCPSLVTATIAYL